MAKIYNFIRYKTAGDGIIDLNELQKLAHQHKPKLILAGFSSYTRSIDYEGFKRIADEVGALTMMDMAHIAGLIAGKQLTNPVPLFDIVTTTTHKTLRGPRGGMILCKSAFAQKIDKAVFPGLQGGPHENVIAAKAVSFQEALTPEFREYAKQVILNAHVLCTQLQQKGYQMLFGGTENHMMLIDTYVSCGIGGKQAEITLDKVGLTVNKNVIPDDPRPPLDPSGIRIGTPSMTTRGMKEKEMELIAEIIDVTLKNPSEDNLLFQRSRIQELCAKFPIYPNLSYTS